MLFQIFNITYKPFPWRLKYTHSPYGVYYRWNICKKRYIWITGSCHGIKQSHKLPLDSHIAHVTQGPACEYICYCYHILSFSTGLAIVGTDIKEWICSYIRWIIRDVITHPYPNLNWVILHRCNHLYMPQSKGVISGHHWSKFHRRMCGLQMNGRNFITTQ